MLENQHVRLAGLKSASTASPDLWIRFVLVTCYWFLAGMCQARRTLAGSCMSRWELLNSRKPFRMCLWMSERPGDPILSGMNASASSSMQASSALPLCHPAFSVPSKGGLHVKVGHHDKALESRSGGHG